MRNWPVWRKAEYRRNQEERDKNKRRAQHNQAQISEKTALRRTIDRNTYTGIGRYYQAERHEHGKAIRDKLTIFVLAIAASVAIRSILQTHRDSDKALMDVQRAFVVPEPLDITSIGGSGTLPIYAWNIRIILDNSGNTAAAHLRFHTMRIWDNLFMPNIRGLNPDTTEYEFDGLPEASISLSPHEKFVFPDLAIKNNAVRLMRKDLLKFFIFGEIDYFDVFDKHHRAKFCYKFAGHSILSNESDIMGRGGTLGDPFISRNLELVKTGLSARLCERNNCSDEDCGTNQVRPVSNRPNLNTIKVFE